MVTNSLSFLPQVDEIIMMDNGTIKEMGTYNKLIEKDGMFSNFVKSYFATKKEEEEEEIEDLENEQETKMKKDRKKTASIIKK